MSNSTKGFISLIGVGVLFGISGVIAKYLSTFLTAYQVVSLRFLVAFILIFIIFIFTKSKIKFSKVSTLSLFIFAVTFPLSVVFFTLAIFNTTVALAVFSFYISTLVSSFVLGRVLFNEAISKNKQISLVCIFIALLIITNPFKSFSLDIGFVYGLLSGILQTITSYYQKTLGKSFSRNSLLLVQTFVGFLVGLIMLSFINQPLFVSLSLIPIMVIVFFGAIFLLISYLFLIGFKYTNLNTGSILISSELLFGPLFAFLLLGENVSSTIFTSGLFILLAVYFSNKD